MAISIATTSDLESMQKIVVAEGEFTAEHAAPMKQLVTLFRMKKGEKQINWGYYGFGSPRKWDWELVWNSHIKTGFGCSRLSRLLGIPSQTVSVILRLCRKTLRGITLPRRPK